MVDSIQGKIRRLQDGCLILAVGPIAVQCMVPTTVYGKERDEIELFVHMHWNQENGPTLYGFASELEKKLFLMITSCSGVGPKIALAVLSDLGVELFLDAVQEGNDKALSSVNGIGPKKAEQMAVQLKHKVAALLKSGVAIQAATAVKWHEVTQVLESLNYSRSEINLAMQHLKKENAQQTLPFDGLIRHALSFLSKKR